MYSNEVGVFCWEFVSLVRDFESEWYGRASSRWYEYAQALIEAPYESILIDRAWWGWTH